MGGMMRRWLAMALGMGLVWGMFGVAAAAEKGKTKGKTEKSEEEQAPKVRVADLADYGLAVIKKEEPDELTGHELTITGELLRAYDDKTGVVLFVFPDKQKGVNVVVEFKSPVNLTPWTRLNVTGKVEAVEVLPKELQAPVTVWTKLEVEEKGVKKTKGGSSSRSAGLPFDELAVYAETYMSLPKAKRSLLPSLQEQQIAEFEETVQSTNKESRALNFTHAVSGWEITVRTRTGGDFLQYDVVRVSDATIAEVTVTRKNPMKNGSILVICNTASLTMVKQYPRKKTTSTAD